MKKSISHTPLPQTDSAAEALRQICCPTCSGSGWISDPNQTLTQALIEHFGYRTAFTARQVAEGSIVGDKSPRSIGKRLAKLAPYGVEQIDGDKHGAIWWIVRV